MLLYIQKDYVSKVNIFAHHTLELFDYLNTLNKNIDDLQKMQQCVCELLAAKYNCNKINNDMK